MSGIVEWTRVQIPLIEGLEDTRDVLGFGLDRAEARGLWLEFGVAAGGSLRRIVAAAQAVRGRAQPRVYGFDSFEGLPEDWRWNPHQCVPKGTFRQETIPVVEGADLVVGLFENTLLQWMGTQAVALGEWPPVTLVHIDCDLYKGARYALHHIGPWLADGAIIVFDELWGYHGFDAHEWRALYEVAIEEKGFSFEWIARKAQDQQVAIRVHR